MSTDRDRDLEELVFEEHLMLMNRELDCFLQWVTLLNETMQIVWKGSSAARDLEILFIKLHGLLAEGQNQIQMHFIPAELIKLMNKDNFGIIFPEDYLQICKSLFESLEKIKSLVSKEDLEALEYLRHKASHPYIESYRLSFGPNNKLKIERRGENKKVLRLRVESHLEKFGGVQPFAYELVRRLKDHVPRLLACIQMQCIRHSTLGSKSLANIFN